MNRNVLYIGVAGLLAEHVREVAEFYENLVVEIKSNKIPPILFLGLQTSRKFLNGEQVNPNFASRMNNIDQIKKACHAISGLCYSNIIVHYNPSGGYNLAGTVDHLKQISQTLITGIQFNGFSTKQTEEVSKIMSTIDNDGCGISLILQIGKDDYENPKHFAKNIKKFSFLNPTHFLLDGSGGRGLPIDDLKAISWLKELQSSNNKKGLVISGGLGADTFDIVRRIRNSVSYSLEISIDAEGKLREEQGFSVEKTKKFLKRAIKFYV